MATDLASLPDAVQRIVAEIREHPKVVAIFLFGSWARGEQMPISDVDIAVLLDNPDKSDEADIGSMYSPTVDVVLFHRLPDTYGQVFDVLYRQGVIPFEAAGAGKRLVYLRNLIAHEYHVISEQELLEAVDLLSKVEELLTVAKREVTHQDG